MAVGQSSKRNGEDMQGMLKPWPELTFCFIDQMEIIDESRFKEKEFVF